MAKEINVKRVPQNKFAQTVDDLTVNGWKVKTQSNNVAIMTKPGTKGTFLGHMIVFVLFGWWTCCFANLAYAGYEYYVNKQETHVKTDEAE